jgi:O-antigen/teichoic acid export membrane protein
MSFKRRFFLGGSAGLVLMGVTAISQIALVPLLLSRWSPEEYGVWVTVQALVAFSTVLSMGYKTYLEFEFLRIGHLEPDEISRLLYSSLAPVLLLALFETLLVLLITEASVVAGVLGLVPSLANNAGHLWLILSLSWLLGTVIPGVFQRAFTPFGFYANNAWWSVLLSILNLVVLVLTVLMGGGLVGAGVATCVSNVLMGGVRTIYLVRIQSRFGIIRCAEDYSVLRQSISQVVAVAAKNAMITFQQQGVRVVLAGMLGPALLASFSTVRTLSNVVMQGNQAVLYPLVPEVMRFVNEKKSEKVGDVFGLMWLLGLLGGSVFLVVLQFFMGWIFNVWTRGKLHFDPLLFAGLAASLIVFSLYQPFLAVIKGMNMVRAQFYSAAISTALLLVLLILLGPVYGLPVIGLVVLACESMLAGFYFYYARRGLESNGIRWPVGRVRMAVISTVIFSILVFASWLMGVLNTACLG